MKAYVMKNGFEIVIDFENARIASIKKADEFIDGNIPFYAVKLRDGNGKSRIIDGGGEFVSFNGSVAKYFHNEIDVSIYISDKNDRLIWRIKVVNKTEDLLEWVELASFGVHGKLKDEENGKGSIILTYNEGVEVTNMRQRENTQFAYIEPDYPSLGAYYVFPYKISSQFMGYLLNGKGIYVGMHDTDRTPKHIDFRYVENSIKLQTRVFCNVDYGENYSMDFDTVMAFFDGDWQDACDIYREWFVKNLPQDVKKIGERADLPKWYGESPLVVGYPVRGAHDLDEIKPNGMFPYKNAIPFLKELSEKTDSKVMALLMHWEGTAPWAPPYVWPPYGGERIFNEFIDELHARNMLIGVYGSGIGWTQYSKIMPEYNKEEEFKNEGLDMLMCSDTDGRLEGGICRPQKYGYDFCSKPEKTKEIIEKEWAQVCKSNLDYVQAFDQNHGGCSYFCYSKKHGHIPAPGKWQIEESVELIKRIKKHGDNIIFGCETATSEPFLAQLSFSDNRYELNYFIGLPIPMYSYLYHEYINNFMGNQVGMYLSFEKYNLPYRLAYSFLAGDMLTIIINDEGKIQYAWGRGECLSQEERGNALKFIKTLNSWRKDAAKDFLNKGRMVKPLSIPCGKNTFKHIKNDCVKVDEILTAAYEFDGKIMQFIVNYNDYPVEIEFEKTPATVYRTSDLSNREVITAQFCILPFSAVAFEL